MVLVALLLITVTFERRRAERAAKFHDTAVELAAVLASSVPPQSLLDSSALGGNGDMLPEIEAVGVYRFREGQAEPELAEARGTLEPPQSRVRERARRMVAEALRSGEALREGNALAVPAPLDPDEIGRGARPSVLYIELAPVDVDPVAASQAIFLVIVAAGLVLLAVTWFTVDRVVARPLHEVALGAQRVAEGDYSLLVPASGADDEIQKVISVFNSMMVDLGAGQERTEDRIGEALRKARATQESLVIAQRLAATGTLAAGIAHEVNNPLGGMLNAVRALRTKDMTPEKRNEYLLLVEEGLRRVQATVAKILKFTPHKIAPQRVDLSDVVRPALALARHRIEKHEVDVVVDLSEEPAPVFGDPYELQQALLNVLLNALDALEEHQPEHPHVLLRTVVDDAAVHLLVRDNGPGMEDADLARAFDLFFTTKEQGKGSGLGLGTVHQIISDHGGRVEMQRGPEGGLDVRFVLPRLREGG